MVLFTLDINLDALDLLASAAAISVLALLRDLGKSVVFLTALIQGLIGYCFDGFFLTNCDVLDVVFEALVEIRIGVMAGDN